MADLLRTSRATCNHFGWGLVLVTMARQLSRESQAPNALKLFKCSGIVLYGRLLIENLVSIGAFIGKCKAHSCIPASHRCWRL